MALDKDRLGNALADRVITIMGLDAPGAPDEADLRTIMKALADEIVKEFTVNGVTSTTGVTGVGTPGGPLPIVAVAGTIT